jgi:outer membrane beta-barrel protein
MMASSKDGTLHVTVVKKLQLFLLFLCLGALAVPLQEAKAQGKFDAYEIRVIRPKYMTKRGRIELGGEMSLIMNQSFIYSLLATGLLDYHFTEMFALELGASYGFSIDKEDKRILKDEFGIQTQILRTQYIFSGSLLWTPIYGKTQLTSGRLVYFDSFLTAGAGMTGIDYNYEQCIPADAGNASGAPTDKPAQQTKGYPTFIMGIGQKFFLSRDFGLRWDLRDHFFQYEKGDGTCTPDTPQGKAVQQNVTLQLGASTFF